MQIKCISLITAKYKNYPWFTAPTLRRVFSCRTFLTQSFHNDPVTPNGLKTL